MARIPACGSDCPRRTLTARQCPPGYCAEAALGLAVQAPGGRLWRNHLTKRAIRGQTADHPRKLNRLRPPKILPGPAVSGSLPSRISSSGRWKTCPFPSAGPGVR